MRKLVSGKICIGCLSSTSRDQWYSGPTCTNCYQKKKSKTLQNCIYCGPTTSQRWYFGVCARCYKKQWRTENRMKVRAQAKNWHELHPNYKVKNERQWRQKNGEKAKLRSKRWTLKNKPMIAERRARYRAAQLSATPSWLTLEQHREIRRFYETCPKGYEVDHIIPLQSKEVCGLHVPWNLQHLSRSENAKKSNKLLAA